MGKVFRNPELERRIQERLYLRLSTKHEIRIRRELKAQYQAAAASVEAGRKPPKINSKKLVQTVGALMGDAFAEQGKRTASAVIESIGRGGKANPTMSAEFERELERYVSIYAGQKVVDVSKTTKDRIASIVRQGITEGWSNRETAQKIRELGQIDSQFRANMIARTESHAAMNAGSLASATDSGVVLEKEWIHSTDSRTRDGRWNHTNVKNVPIDKPFIVSGEELNAPGDPSGSAGNIINCRCAVGYVV